LGLMFISSVKHVRFSLHRFCDGVTETMAKHAWYPAGRSLTSSAVWIQYTNVSDSRTDGDTGRQQRPPRVRIASRGNKKTTLKAT